MLRRANGSRTSALRGARRAPRSSLSRQASAALRLGRPGLPTRASASGPGSASRSTARMYKLAPLIRSLVGLACISESDPLLPDHARLCREPDPKMNRTGCCPVRKERRDVHAVRAHLVGMMGEQARSEFALPTPPNGTPPRKYSPAASERELVGAATRGGSRTADSACYLRATAEATSRQ